MGRITEGFFHDLNGVLAHLPLPLSTLGVVVARSRAVAAGDLGVELAQELTHSQAALVRPCLLGGGAHLSAQLILVRQRVIEGAVLTEGLG